MKLDLFQMHPAYKGSPGSAVLPVIAANPTPE